MQYEKTAGGYNVQTETLKYPDLIDKLRNIDISLNSQLITFDMKSLDILLNKIDYCDLSNNNKIKLRNIFETSLNQNFCKFIGNIYRQIGGLPMESLLSPMFSEIYKVYFETWIFSETNKNLIQ